MKRLFCLMAIVTLVASSCGQREKDGYTISGKLLDYNGFATLRFTDPADDRNVLDTVKLVDGEFCFSGQVSEPCFGQIVYYTDDGTRIRSSIIVENYDLVANENPGYMVVEGPGVITARNLFYHGGRNNDAFQAVRKSYAYLDDEPQFKGIEDIYVQMNNCGSGDLNKYIELRTGLYDRYGKKNVNKYNKAKNEAVRKFIMKHRDIEISAYLLEQYGAHDMPLDELEEAYNSFPKKVRESNLAYGLTSLLDSRREKEAE